MSINLQTLKCAECGSHALKAQAINQYVCEHCGTVAIAEDNVTERLDRVLETVKDEAARRIAQEKAAREEEEAGVLGWVVLGLIAVGLVALGGWLFSGKSESPSETSATRTTTPALGAAERSRSELADRLKVESREVVIRRSSRSMDPALLVTLHNHSDTAVRDIHIRANFREGGRDSRDVFAKPPISLIQAGESVPILIAPPPNLSTNARHELFLTDAAAVKSSRTGEALRFEKVRLLEQDGSLRLAGRLRNPFKDQPIAGFEVLVVLYDEAGAVLGFGSETLHTATLAPGEARNVDTRIHRFSAAGVKAWDYRISYFLPNGQSRASVIAADRIVRAETAPEVLSADMEHNVDDLLMDEGTGFDMTQLELLPFTTGREMGQDVVYMTELVNRSSDTIAVSPRAMVTLFDGHREVGSKIVGNGVAYLHPGERIPIRLTPKPPNRATQMRIEWKPARKMTLPGARRPLEVKIDGTQAKVGTVEVNFSRTHKYRHVIVRGTVSNPGTSLVRKGTLWVSLRDRENRLTGFELKELRPIPPGESVPFQVDVEQWGRDFESVGTMYQAE